MELGATSADVCDEVVGASVAMGVLLEDGTDGCAEGMVDGTSCVDADDLGI